MDSLPQGVKRVDEPLPPMSTYEEALAREGDDEYSRFRALANMVTVLDLLIREVERRCEARHQEQMAALLTNKERLDALEAGR